MKTRKVEIQDLIPFAKTVARIAGETTDEMEMMGCLFIVQRIMNMEGAGGVSKLGFYIDKLHESEFNDRGVIYGSSDKREVMKRIREDAFQELVRIERMLNGEDLREKRVVN